MTRFSTTFALLLMWLAPQRLMADEAPHGTEHAGHNGAEAVHEELRELRRALTAALEKGDAEAQLKLVHKDAVTTWQNNQVVRGHDNLKKFLAEMSNGNKKVFKGYKVPPEADDLTILYGDSTGIAFGKSVPHYSILGMEFDLENRWTATLVKDDEGWKIAAYHVSANVLDNPVLDIARRSATWAGGIGGLVGVVVGCVGCALLRRTKRAA